MALLLPPPLQKLVGRGGPRCPCPTPPLPSSCRRRRSQHVRAPSAGYKLAAAPTLPAASSCACSLMPWLPARHSWLPATACMPHCLWPEAVGNPPCPNPNACSLMPCSTSHVRARFCLGCAARHSRRCGQLAAGPARREQQQRRGRCSGRRGGQPSRAAAGDWDCQAGASWLPAKSRPPGVQLSQVACGVGAALAACVLRVRF